ncbi:hypothetical protein SJ_200 [Proteus phage SJ_PmiM]|nr:hypothetical protein SJ_200 [Proteus phage SJ_PmiM]
MYIAFHIVSESSDHYTFCETVEFTEQGMDMLFDTLIKGSDIPGQIYYEPSESLSVSESRMVKEVISRLYNAEY